MNNFRITHNVNGQVEPLDEMFVTFEFVNLKGNCSNIERISKVRKIV